MNQSALLVKEENESGIAFIPSEARGDRDRLYIIFREDVIWHKQLQASKRQI